MYSSQQQASRCFSAVTPVDALDMHLDAENAAYVMIRQLPQGMHTTCKIKNITSAQYQLAISQLSQP
jgi:hypothetical protein